MRVEGRTGQGRRRTRIVGAMATAAVAVGLTVPWVGAEASKTGWHHGHHGDDDSGKLLFFASDGLVQNRVEEFADDGDTPGFRELLQEGHAAPRTTAC